jgi:uncharacterized protein (TIGR02466 family)
MELTTDKKSEVERIFPTPIYKAHIGREISKKEKNTVEKYLSKNELNNLTGLNLHSKDTYVLKDEAFDDLNKFLQYHIENFFYNVLHADPQNKIYITQSWLNITTENQSHHNHEHPNSYISGVFYFNTGAEDKIKFLSPVKYTQIQPKTLKLTEDNSGSWVIPVDTGLLIMFPSRLEHSVLNKKQNNQRISMAFNTFIKGDLGDERGRTHLILE